MKTLQTMLGTHNVYPNDPVFHVIRESMPEWKFARYTSNAPKEGE